MKPEPAIMYLIKIIRMFSVEAPLCHIPFYVFVVLYWNTVTDQQYGLWGLPRCPNNQECELPNLAKNKWLYSSSGQKRCGVSYSGIVTLNFTWLAQVSSASRNNITLCTVWKCVSPSAASHTENDSIFWNWSSKNTAQVCQRVLLRTHTLALGLEISWLQFFINAFYAVPFHAFCTSSVVRETFRARYQWDQPAMNSGLEWDRIEWKASLYKPRPLSQPFHAVTTDRCKYSQCMHRILISYY